MNAESNRLAPASGGAAKSLVILLHGYGANGEDLIDLAGYWRDALPDTEFVSPNAPQVCPGAPGGYQWFPLFTRDIDERNNGAQSAAPGLNSFIDAEMARLNLPAIKVALVGFSQGTMMALEVGPRREPALAGILGFSGMLVDPLRLYKEGRTRPPTLLIHGDADEVIDVAALHDANEKLATMGFPVQAHAVPGLGHGISADGVEMGRDFLTLVFKDEA